MDLEPLLGEPADRDRGVESPRIGEHGALHHPSISTLRTRSTEREVEPSLGTTRIVLSPAIVPAMSGRLERSSTSPSALAAPRGVRITSSSPRPPADGGADSAK